MAVSYEHYGAPTRLLDWTYSFYVAVYFAIESVNPGECCAVWAVDNKWLKEEAMKKLPTHITKDDDPNLKNPKNVKSFLFASPPIPSIIPLNPLRMNERLVLQQGIFLAPGDVTQSFMDNLPSLANEDESHLTKFEIHCTEQPSSSRRGVLESVD
jgi:hypothetical protein